MKPTIFFLAANCFALGAALAATPPKGLDSPEVEYLRKLIAEQQKHPDKIIRSLPVTNAPLSTNTAALRSPAPAPAAASSESPKTAAPGRARETTVATPTAEEARQKRISEVEARLDEMLRQKEAREKAALTNAAATNQTSATPLTKRQRLDDLLRQMIDGKITAAEYSQRREKIIADPD
jgi:hypothetical protein